MAANTLKSVGLPSSCPSSGGVAWAVRAVATRAGMTNRIKWIRLNLYQFSVVGSELSALRECYANRPFQPFTRVHFFRKSGSNSTPMPGVEGTAITPFLMSKFGVYHDSFFCGARHTYSM